MTTEPACSQQPGPFTTQTFNVCECTYRVLLGQARQPSAVFPQEAMQEHSTECPPSGSADVRLAQAYASAGSLSF